MFGSLDLGAMVESAGSNCAKLLICAILVDIHLAVSIHFASGPHISMDSVPLFSAIWSGVDFADISKASEDDR